MSEAALLGIGRTAIPLPRAVWMRDVKNQKTRTATVAALPADTHRVRDYVVRELPRAAGPLTPGAIAAALDLPPERVAAILDELERMLTFLYRDPQGAVAWAYPVTTDETPHRVTFSSGETGYAA